jgi:hypothetical protein
MTKTGLATFTFASDPLSIGEVKTAGNQLTILGSGFAQGATVMLDGSTIPSTVVDSQHISASAAAIGAGSHTLSITLSSGETYILDNALDVSAGG